MARFRVKCVSGPQDAPVGISEMDFAIDANHQLVATVVVVMNDELHASMYPGGEASGWVPFQVPAGATIGGIRYALDILATKAVWFAVP